MSTVKISRSALSESEIAEGIIEPNHIIKSFITSYDENESWKLTQTRASKTAMQLVHMHKASRVVIDMPKTFSLHLSKALESYSGVSVETV